MHRYAIPLLAAAALTAPLGTSAQTLDLPPRKSGLWEVTMTMEKPKGMPAMKMKMCLDSATDREMMKHGLKLTDSKCNGLTTRREGNTIVIEADCNIDSVASRTRTVITGDFQSAYSVRIEGTTTETGEEPQRTLMTQTVKWKSADCPGMEVGDITMFGGIKINIKQIKAMSGLLR